MFSCLYARVTYLLMTNIHCFDEGSQDLQIGQTTRVRNFPHVEGNYALHVYIPSKLIMICKESYLSVNILFDVFIK